MATAADILGARHNGKIPARWSKHYLRLCAERDRLLARDCCAPEPSPIKLDDLTETASEESETNLSLVAAMATKNAIFEVLAAIQRIERGTYGICELTGAPIETERLRAIPWTRYSLRGQSDFEKTGAARRFSLPKLGSLQQASLGDEGENEESDTD